MKGEKLELAGARHQLEADYKEQLRRDHAKLAARHKTQKIFVTYSEDGLSSDTWCGPRAPWPRSSAPLVGSSLSSTSTISHSAATTRSPGGGCRQQAESCQCQSLIMEFKPTITRMSELGVLDKLADQVVMEIVQEKINSHVQDTCKFNLTI